LHLKLRTIGYKKQEKKDRKNYVLQRGEKLSSKKIFFSSPIFYRCFFGDGQFSPNLKPYSDRPISTQHRFKKSGGVMGRLF
jgi:adenine specific DNA methylase Mod